MKDIKHDFLNEIIECVNEDTLDLSNEAQDDLEEALEDVKNDRLI